MFEVIVRDMLHFNCFVFFTTFPKQQKETNLFQKNWQSSNF